MDLAERRALCELALEAAIDAGARYAEARLVGRTREALVLRDGSLELSSSNRDLGLGTRGDVESHRIFNYCFVG